MIDLGPKKEWLENAHHSRTDLQVMQKIVNTVTEKAVFQPNFDLLMKFKLDPNQPLHILDFGAGMLRNSVGLLEMSPLWRVTAYDSSEMLARGYHHFHHRLRPREVAKRFTMESDWNKILEARPIYSAICCVLVLQHIDETPLRLLLNHFRRLSSLLLVYGRRSLDDLEVRPDNWTPVWPIITEQWQPQRLFHLPDNPEPNLLQGAAEDHCGGIFIPKV